MTDANPQRRLICLHDEIAFIGGGEQMLLRVAAIARRRARTELGLLWRRPIAFGAKDLDGFDCVAEFDFPEDLALRNGWAESRSLRRLSAWLDRRPAALLSFGLRTTLHVALLARWKGLPLGWLCQQNLPLFDSKYAAAKQRIAGRILTLGRTQIICISERDRRAFTALGVPDDRLRCIRNGVDVEHFAGVVLSREAKRARRLALGIPETDFVAVCVARLDQNKDHPTLLRAVQRAVAGGTRMVLVCVGGASPRAEYGAELKALAGGLGLSSQVVWVGHQEDVRPWLEVADVAVLASRRECASLALAEAAACGLPIVGSRVGGIPEIAIEGDTGLLFEPGDAAGCAAALTALARDAERRGAMGERARALARRDFDTAASDEQWSRFLDTLLDGGAHG